MVIESVTNDRRISLHRVSVWKLADSTAVAAAQVHFTIHQRQLAFVENYEGHG
jgi:hypothetical protein